MPERKIGENESKIDLSLSATSVSIITPVPTTAVPYHSILFCCPIHYHYKDNTASKVSSMPFIKTMQYHSLQSN